MVPVLNVCLGTNIVPSIMPPDPYEDDIVLELYNSNETHLGPIRLVNVTLAALSVPCRYNLSPSFKNIGHAKSAKN
jgi:hypothetical protein